MPKLHKFTHNAFSLFEALLCIVILGIIGVICNSMLLNITQNITYAKSLNSTSAHIALLQIENLLQYAIIESIQTQNAALLNAPTSAITFSSIQEPLLFGGGVKASNQEVLNNTLLPHISLHIQSHHDDILYFDKLKGWQKSQEAYLFTEPKEPFKPYHIVELNTQSLKLDRNPTHTPLAILPIQAHQISFHDNILWLDNTPLAHNVHSFLITPLFFTEGTFLELELCISRGGRVRCQNGGVWLDHIMELIL